MRTPGNKTILLILGALLALAIAGCGGGGSDETETSTPTVEEPTALTQDELLGLFSSAVTGADYVLTPATDVDMRGKYAQPKASLEVVYDDV